MAFNNGPLVGNVGCFVSMLLMKVFLFTWHDKFIESPSNDKRDVSVGELKTWQGCGALVCRRCAEIQ